MGTGRVSRLVQLAVRTANKHQLEQQRRFNVEVCDMRSWPPTDALLTFSRPLYVTIDLDSLDPAFAPGVSHFEPGGLTTRQLLRTIRRISAPRIIGFDIVEYNPDRDPTGVTAMVAAKILKELA